MGKRALSSKQLSKATKPTSLPESVRLISKSLEEEEKPNLYETEDDKNKVVLYFTSLRGIRKTYEDCCCVRTVLRGYQVAVLIRGVHVGGMEEIKKLNDGGKLGEMLKGLPVCESLGACGCCGDPRSVWSSSVWNDGVGFLSYALASQCRMSLRSRSVRTSAVLSVLARVGSASPGGVGLKLSDDVCRDSGTVARGVVYALASSSYSLLRSSSSVHDLSCGPLSTGSAHPGWSDVRWSVWAVDVLRECPELQLSVRDFALRVCPSQYRSLSLKASIGSLISSLQVPLHLIRRSQLNLVLVRCSMNRLGVRSGIRYDLGSCSSSICA
uniref:Glutaredoxin domain-containing protein n=1 Tax=Brassica oleracea var. oleracea TaxID=109376 RepID=A0A0D3E7L5_BRAOL